MEFKGLTDCYVKLVDISVAHVCPFCSKTFASSKKMNKHVSNVHKVKGVIKGMAKSGVDEFGKYKCPLCPRVFKYSYNRARHLRRCIKEQTNGANWKIGSKYQCPLCKEIFSLTNNRTRHIQNNCLRSYLRKLAKANPKISLANKEVPSTTTDPEDIRVHRPMCFTPLAHQHTSSVPGPRPQINTASVRHKSRACGAKTEVE